MRWEPRADFDVLGILYLMQNVLPLAALGLFIFFLAGGVYCGVRGLLTNRGDV